MFSCWIFKSITQKCQKMLVFSQENIKISVNFYLSLLFQQIQPITNTRFLLSIRFCNYEFSSLATRLEKKYFISTTHDCWSPFNWWKEERIHLNTSNTIEFLNWHWIFIISWSTHFVILIDKPKISSKNNPLKKASTMPKKSLATTTPKILPRRNNHSLRIQIYINQNSPKTILLRLSPSRTSSQQKIED